MFMRRRNPAWARAAEMGWPSKRISPPLGAYSPTARRATVDLPQPLSPTSDSVVPRGMAKLMLSTARRLRRGWPVSIRCSQGLETSKLHETSIASSTISLAIARTGTAARSSVMRRLLGIEPAGRLGRAGVHQHRAFDKAAIGNLRAARIEGAALRNGIQARHGAVDLTQTFDAMLQAGNTGHQPFGVGMRGLLHHVTHR